MFLVKASLVLALAQAIVAVFPRLSASIKHLILVTGMAAFPVIPLLEATVPAVRLAPVEGRASARPVQTPAVRPVRRAEARRSTLAQEAVVGLNGVAALIWLAGMIAIFTRLLRARRRVRAIVRGAVAPSPRVMTLFDAHPRVRLLRSARVHVPMVWGLRSGTLLLPEAAETWSDEELRATFIHEVGHLQRLDYLSLGLMNVITALLWFHPQVWLARRMALAEGERACDDLVLCAGGRPSEYARHLLEVARFARPREPLAALLAMARPHQLERRMHSILSPSTDRRSIGGIRLMITLATFLAVVIPISALQLAAQTPASPSPIISAEQLEGRQYHVVEKLAGRVCTLKLRRPTPAEAVAMQRLQQKAGEYRVDGVANVRCHREVSIGLRCPTQVICEGDAIEFEDK